MLSYNNDADVLINDCIFEISKHEKYSVFYDGGHKGSLFKLNKCTFTGKLSPGSNYIGRWVVSNNSPKLVVKMCKFDIDLKNWNELNSNSIQFMKIDVNEQVFKNCEKKNGFFDLSSVVIVFAAAVLVVCLLITFSLKNKANNDDKSDESEADKKFWILWFKS